MVHLVVHGSASKEEADEEVKVGLEQMNAAQLVELDATSLFVYHDVNDLGPPLQVEPETSSSLSKTKDHAWNFVGFFLDRQVGGWCWYSGVIISSSESRDQRIGVGRRKVGLLFPELAARIAVCSHETAINPQMSAARRGCCFFSPVEKSRDKLLKSDGRGPLRAGILASFAQDVEDGLRFYEGQVRASPAASVKRLNPFSLAMNLSGERVKGVSSACAKCRWFRSMIAASSPFFVSIVCTLQIVVRAPVR
jgi:hypothetical protein